MSMVLYETNLPSVIDDLILDFLMISECQQKKLMLKVLYDINTISEIVLEGETYPIRDIVEYINIGRVPYKLMGRIYSK